MKQHNIKIEPTFVALTRKGVVVVNENGDTMHDLIAKKCGIDLSKYRIVHRNGNGLDNRTANLVAVPRTELN